jgi:hypothetical protein
MSGGSVHMPPDGSGLRFTPTKPSSSMTRLSSGMQFFGETPGNCGSWPTPTKFSGSSAQMRWMRSFETLLHSMLIASVPTWCAMPPARGEKTVRSPPRSFWNLSCGATLFTSTSSLMARSRDEGRRAASARPASCLSRKACSAGGSVV